MLLFLSPNIFLFILKHTVFFSTKSLTWEFSILSFESMSLLRLLTKSSVIIWSCLLQFRNQIINVYHQLFIAILYWVEFLYWIGRCLLYLIKWYSVDCFNLGRIIYLSWIVVAHIRMLDNFLNVQLIILALYFCI